MPRVIFTFDDRSIESLKYMTEDSGSSSMAATVREALRMAYALREQAKEGFVELILRNPSNGDRRTIVIDFLTRSQSATAK